MISWLPSGRAANGGWHFDIVGLLAVLGEASAGGVSDLITASWICWLPRLMPAPHALLRPERRYRLPGCPAHVIGVYGGTRRSELGYFPNIIHGIQELNRYEVQVYTAKFSESGVEENLKMQRDSEKHAKGHLQGLDPRKFKAIRNGFFRLDSLLAVLVYFSVLLTICLFLLAALTKDGVGCIAIPIMALASACMNAASQWDSILVRWPIKGVLPPGDVAIARANSAAMILVHCSEEVARELCFGPDTVKHLMSNTTYYSVAGAGTLLLMFGVVLLGNCGWTMQIAVGATYILLNALYWAANFVPGRNIWNLNRYDVQRVADPQWSARGFSEAPENFTQMLWYAIQETKSTQWIIDAGIAPLTPAWRNWFGAAQVHCNDPDWDAVGYKNELMLNESKRVEQLMAPTLEEHPDSEETTIQLTDKQSKQASETQNAAARSEISA